MLESKLKEVLFFLPSSVQEKQRKLNNGNKFPMVTFGITKLDGIENIYKAVDIALEVGYRSFECEPKWDQEKCLGRVLNDLLPKYDLKRRDLFIISKLFSDHYGRDSTRKAFRRTCTDLDTNYLDLYLMNWPGGRDLNPDAEENLNLRKETWEEMTKLNKSGSIRSIGVSNFEVRHLEYFRDLHLATPAVNQVEFHPRFPQKKLLYYCQKNDVLLQATSFQNTVHPLLLKDDEVKKIARNVRRTPTQVILKWILNNGVAVISQSEKPKVIRKNFSLYDFVLEKPDMEAITSIRTREKFLMNPVIVI